MTQNSETIHYEHDESAPLLVSVGVGFQFVLMTLMMMASYILVIFQSTGQPGSYVSWNFFAALAVCGVCTILQAVRIGRFGAGHILIMGPSPMFISVSITVLAGGGPGMLSGLIIVSSLVQFAIATRLAALRRVITPLVSGTIFMLVTAIAMPSLFDMMRDTSGDTSPAAAPIAAGATLATFVFLTLWAPRSWRMWMSLIVIAIGCAVFAVLVRTISVP